MNEFFLSLEQFFNAYFWILPLFALWSLYWKGRTLWVSSRLGQKKWFVVLLVVNTVGILEILYLFVFSRKQEKKTNSQ